MPSSRSRPSRKPRSLAEVAASLTEAEWADLRASADAEAAGDPVEALRLLSLVPVLDGSGHRGVLATLVELGDDAPGWMWSRWATLQAQRWPWRDSDPDGPAPAGLAEVVAGLYADGVDLRRVGLPSGEDFLASLVRRDWCLRQLTVHEGGGLRRFLDRCAGAGLVARADHLGQWAEAAMGPYRLESDDTGVLELTDLADGARIEVLDLGLLEDHAPGTVVLGRLVPTDCAPGRMFDWAPLRVDEATAAAVADDPAGWFETLAERRGAGLLPELFSYVDEPALVSDLPQRAWLGLLEESQVGRLPQADGKIAVVDAVLRATANVLAHVERIGPGISVCRWVVATMLLEPGTGEKLRDALAHPRHVRSWRLLEVVLPPPASERCRELAALAEARRRRAS